MSQAFEGARSVSKNFPAALKFGMRLGSTAAEPPVKFQNNINI